MKVEKMLSSKLLVTLIALPMYIAMGYAMEIMAETFVVMFQAPNRSMSVVMTYTTVSLLSMVGFSAAASFWHMYAYLKVRPSRR